MTREEAHDQCRIKGIQILGKDEQWQQQLRQ